MNIDWMNTLLVLPGILLGLTVHEYCHAFAALKLGDPTARDQGRITLNPLKHIDFVGFIFLLLVGFGWAKPVQFNPANLRNLRRDRAIIAAAGPLSNLVLGTLIMLIVRALLNRYGPGIVDNLLFTILFRAGMINFALFVFNLLPIPPLDGSHILFSGLNLKPEIEVQLMKIGMPLLLVILLVQNFTEITLLPIGEIIFAMIRFILQL